MEKKKSSLAVRMSISLVCGLVAGLLLMMLRENLNSTGKEAVWATINSILFQDITAAGAEKALGIFYIVGQLFIRSLQLVIVPMVFTSITLAIGQISDTRTLGRISVRFPDLFFLRITYGMRSRNHGLQCRCFQYPGRRS